MQNPEPVSIPTVGHVVAPLDIDFEIRDGALHARHAKPASLDPARGHAAECLPFGRLYGIALEVAAKLDGLNLADALNVLERIAPGILKQSAIADSSSPTFRYLREVVAPRQTDC